MKYSRLKSNAFFLFILILLVTQLMQSKAVSQSVDKSSISGELKQWHKVTLTVLGPHCSEDGDPNPFADYRMQVTFRHPATGLTYEIPGYFAADGNAANSSADAGNCWRAHLSPDHVGQWEYSVSFRKGPQVATSDDPAAGIAVDGADGLKGSFLIAATDKTGRDFRGHGRLNYVGEHHLKFAGSKKYFLKAGVDAPENLLAYADFDGDFKSDGHKDNLVKTWSAHVKDWKEGDPSWGDGKGKGLIGAVNYLAGQGLNAFSFLTLNINGDDQNVFPYTTYDERLRLDCSRMDQWEMVFSHGTKLGMYLHFKTLECENVNLLDEGNLGPQRKLYYRELMARFGHHLALNWNLGEEVGYINPVSTDKKVAWAGYFADKDPYNHHIVIHNGNKHYEMMGDASALTGMSLQTSQQDFRFVHYSTLDYLRRSVKAGKPWVVACDEPGDASHSLVPDAEDPTHDNPRRNALWGNLMAGGAGVEWYFGYKHAHSDLTCQDFRVRENMWKQSRIALEFFADNKIPFWKMSNANKLLSTKNAFCLVQPKQLYLVFLKRYEPTVVDLKEATGGFEILWFDPRHGGKLQAGSVLGVRGGQKVSIGKPPRDLNEDWVAILRPNAQISIDEAASNPKIAKPDSGVELKATRDFNFVEADEFVAGYVDKARDAFAIDAAKFRDRFAAAESTFKEKSGIYDLLLTTLTETDGESTYQVFVNGELIGKVQNPGSKNDYDAIRHRFNSVNLKTGDTIRVTFNSASNGKIPEGDGFAFARGRWRSLRILEPGTILTSSIQRKPAAKKPASPPPFKFTYNPAKASKVHVQSGKQVVVEAEDFDAVDRQHHRKWNLTTLDSTPDVKPDPDPNHAEKASGNAYLEILPDTRVTHSDPLVNGVSFTNTPGECSVLYYPIEFKTAGRYYVWVRMCCTGSEDNGLHVGIDGNWPASGARLQFTGKHGQFQWDSRQRTQKVHTGVLGQIWLDVPTPGLHTIMFSMREDGFEFDKFMLTTENSPMKSKSTELGPDASPQR